jgi:uncharacterized membrane protein YhhN
MDKLIRYFTPVFLALLFLDIYVKTNLPIIPYRYYSKIFVLVTLIIFTGYCVYKKNKLNNRYVFYGLIIFFIGDILIIDHLNKVKFIISLILFVVGKLIYIFKFTHKEDFNNKRLLPFLVVCFLFVAFLYILSHDSFCLS